MIVTVGSRPISLSNPAQTWVHLRNVREYLADGKWVKGTWIEAQGMPGVDSPMCLANTLRHVAVGTRGRDQDYGRDNGSEAELLVTYVMREWIRENTDFGGSSWEIPDFNDDSRTTITDTLAILDQAIALVAPERTVVAEDVMTDEEKAEIADALDRDFTEQWQEWKAGSQSWIDDLIARGWKVWGETLEGWTEECQGENCPDKDEVPA